MSKPQIAPAHVDEALTSAETEEKLKISRPTLYRYVKRGWLNPTRLPTGILRFKRTEVESLLNGNAA